MAKPDDKLGNIAAAAAATVAAADIAADEGLVCLNCGYNLTGLRDDRCPECGDPFDRNVLRNPLVGNPGPVPIWSGRASRGSAQAFVATVFTIVVKPGRWVRRLPPNIDPADLGRFRWACFSVATSLMIAAALLLPIGLPDTFILLAAWLVGARVCDAMVSSIAIGAGDTDCSWARRQRCRGVGDSLCAYLLPTSLAFALAAIALHVHPGLAPQRETLLLLVFLFTGLWWWIAIVYSAYLLGQRGHELLSTAAMVPIFVIVSMSVGGMVMFVLGTLVMDGHLGVLW